MLGIDSDLRVNPLSKHFLSIKIVKLFVINLVLLNLIFPSNLLSISISFLDNNKNGGLLSGIIDVTIDRNYSGNQFKISRGNNPNSNWFL